MCSLVISAQVASDRVLECHTPIGTAAVEEGIFMLPTYKIVVVDCGELSESQSTNIISIGHVKH